LPALLILALACSAARLAAGEEEAEGGSGEPRAEAPAETVTVTAPRPRLAASDTVLDAADPLLPPGASPADLMLAVPGLVAAQHAGGGKADQIFLRGFDADHGTDVAVSVDGVPNNLVSHAHGQGYADLHWLIPETIAAVAARKGPYFAEQGDFGTAGSVAFTTRDRFDDPEARVEAGAFGSRRLVALGSPALGRLDAALALEAFTSDGPFEAPQDLRRLSLFAKVGGALSASSSFSLTASAYDGRWNASGQIPERAVASGRIGRFGSVDPTEGGASHRYALAAAFRSRPTPLGSAEFQAFAVDYALDLFSNFTFFAEDPVRGDGIEQVDARRYYGVQGSRRWTAILGGVVLETTTGGGFRLDDADVALHRQARRVRLGTVSDAEVREASSGIFVQEEVSLGRRVRAFAGLRYDAFDFRVDSRLPEGAGKVRSGRARAALVQPKAGLIVSAPQGTDVYLNYGVGFHSNDARATVVNEGGAPALPRARGYEFGARSRPVAFRGRVEAAVSVWRLDLENEIVYVGDAGSTDLRGPSRRQGVELDLRARIAPWLWAGADLALGSARFTKTGDPVPLAPRTVLSGSLTAEAPGGLRVGLRARRVGPRPATEDGRFTARGATVVDLTVGWRREAFEAFAEIENLADADAREAQFYNESRLPWEPAPVGDVHFTPGNPRNLRVGAAWRF
jgi:hypothetical protein